jgi:hypothetical protein
MLNPYLISPGSLPQLLPQHLLGEERSSRRITREAEGRTPRLKRDERLPPGAVLTSPSSRGPEAHLKPVAASQRRCRPLSRSRTRIERLDDT